MPLTRSSVSVTPDDVDIFSRFREIDRCAIFVAFCGRRFGDPVTEEDFPPKLRLLSPHDVFLEQLIDSVNESAFANSNSHPVVSMCERAIYNLIRDFVYLHSHGITTLSNASHSSKTYPLHARFLNICLQIFGGD